jgi:hypothetical protein
MRRAAVHRFTAGLLAVLPLLGAVSGGAATITIVNADGLGEGFNDLTPAVPVAGNSAVTLGQQRLNAFTAAASYWSNRLTSPVPINVFAQMDPLPCSAHSGMLGAAGASSYFANFPNAPRLETWYPAALANALSGAANEPGTPEISARFNSSVGIGGCLTGLNWWYGVGSPAPAGTISFYQTILHEIAHGLGFQTIVDLDTGSRAEGLDDDFMLFLEDHSTGKSWTQMTDSERYTSARDTGDLHWTGPAVVAASSVLTGGRHPSGHVQMYAPASGQPGSSLSHWDTALVPDELLEPIATPSPADLLTTQLLRDIGWPGQAPPPPGGCVRDAGTACLQKGRFEVKVDWKTASGSGPGQVMAFGGQRTENDESVFWWFFSPTNFELGVKVLDACSIGSKLWVFLSGLTNQGWTVHVKDNLTGETKTYTNPVGRLSLSTADTAAFNCR